MSNRVGGSAKERREGDGSLGWEVDGWHAWTADGTTWRIANDGGLEIYREWIADDIAATHRCRPTSPRPASTADTSLPATVV